MFTSAQLVAFVISMIGMPYWYGTCVFKCTSSLLTSKARQYSSHYGASRMPKYRQAVAEKKVCTDCVGLIKGFFWTNGGKGVADYIAGKGNFVSTYASNGCPDLSANGMLDWIKTKGLPHGKIASLPETPGTLLFSPGHVGVYIGGGWAVEARGFAYGVVKTRVKDRGWKEWGLLPESLLRYVDGGAADTPKEAILRNGDDGADVRAMQEALIKMGYDCGRWGADGEFGDATEMALKAFQATHGLEPDGEYGPKSRAAVTSALDKLGAVPADPKTVMTHGGSRYVRSAPNVQGKILGAVIAGTELPYQGETSPEGWLLVEFKGQNGWISGKYGRLSA